MGSNLMAKAHWSCVALAASLIASWPNRGTEIPQAAPAIDAPRPAQSQAPGTGFDEARRLSQQGKYNEAISALHQLESAHPDLKGLSHELGTAYYKMGDYANAIAFLKKALRENAGDSEAEQLLDLPHYLAQRPAEPIPQLANLKTCYVSPNVDAPYIL